MLREKEQQSTALSEVLTLNCIYPHTGLQQNLLNSITVDIIPRLLHNAAFVCIHVVGRFSKDFSEPRGLRNRGFQLQVEWTTVHCVQNYERKCKYVPTQKEKSPWKDSIEHLDGLRIYSKKQEFFYNSVLPGFYKSFWPVSPSETAFKAAFMLERKMEWQEMKTLKQYN